MKRISTETSRQVGDLAGTECLGGDKRLPYEKQIL